MASSANLTSDLRLRDWDNVSPARSLDLVVSYDDEGWPVRSTFSVGQIVASSGNRLFKVIGFTRNDEIIVVQHGLEMDPAIRSLAFTAEGLVGVEAPIAGYALESGYPYGL